MAKQLSSLDMHFLVRELKKLEGSRVDQIYNEGSEDIYLQLHKSNEGKKILRIVVGKSIFLAEAKSADETPSGFCMMLRKYLEGKFLDSIEQIDSERILKLAFKSKDELKLIYLEFFGKGNVILCNNDGIITDSLVHHQFKDRSIAPKEKYKYPNMQCNLFSFNKKDISDLLKNSKKDKLVTCLAIELGFGGVYSEEACLLAGIDKNSEPKKVDDNEVKKIMDSIKKIIGSKELPQIIYKNNEIVDVIPIELESYRGFENKAFSSFNEALEDFFKHETQIKKKESPYTKRINELKRIIEEQEATLKSLKEKEDEFREKGELIYTNYQLIQGILKEINKAKEKYSWEEIKEKLKGHKIVKDINLKDKLIVVEV